MGKNKFWFKVFCGIVSSSIFSIGLYIGSNFYSSKTNANHSPLENSNYKKGLLKRNFIKKTETLSEKFKQTRT